MQTYVRLFAIFSQFINNDGEHCLLVFNGTPFGSFRIEKKKDCLNNIADGCEKISRKQHVRY